jgi:hypothetical protein
VQSVLAQRECQGAPDHEIRPIAGCPWCKAATMTVDAVIPGIFLGGAFLRYRCARCDGRMEVSLARAID